MVFTIAKVLIVLLILALIIDYIIAFKKVKALTGERVVDEKLSLSDDQSIHYTLENQNDQSVEITLVDELPIQFQHRDIITRFTLEPKASKQIDFPIRPTVRGVYDFGNLIGFVSNRFPGLLELKKVLTPAQKCKVYPSVIQMRKYELQLASKTAHLQGIKKTRLIGENDEFEHIRTYVQGDNIKSINWKATSRNQQLMVNQFQESRSQMIYTVIDKGRSMKMPFFDMTLLDHAVNTALIISNIILKKYDKAGLVSFSNKIGSVVKAASNTGQLERITEKLYAQETNFLESNFELLYLTIRKNITRRSILLMFTNFEHPIDLERNLVYLRAISKLHLLIIIIFENNELEKTADLKAEAKSDIYLKTFAQKTIADKERIKMILEVNGIQCVLTKPEDLPVQTINKYLELKSKRMS